MVDIGKKEKLKSVIDDTKTNFQLFFSLVLSFSSKFGHHMNQSLREWACIDFTGKYFMFWFFKKTQVLITGLCKSD